MATSIESPSAPAEPTSGPPGSDSAAHIIPRADGGAVYDIDNLGPSHRRCNYSRGKKPLRPVGIPVESGMAFFKP